MKNIRIVGGPRVSLPNGINSFSWQYNLRTSEESTVGGKVVQILGVDINGLTISADLGGDGDTLRTFARQVGELIEWQVKTGRPAHVTYPRQGYSFNAFLKSASIRDSLDNITYPVSLSFAVDEDLNHIVTKELMGQALSWIKDGIGYTKNRYNDLNYKSGGTNGAENKAGKGGKTTNGQL